MGCSFPVNVNQLCVSLQDEDGHDALTHGGCADQ